MNPLALSNLLHKPIRTAVAVSGVTFAVVLMFMQLGFLGAVTKTANIIYGALDFDVLLRSPTYVHVTIPGSFPDHRLRQAASAEGVVDTAPFHVGITTWRSAKEDPKTKTHQSWGMMTMGVRLGTQPFQDPELMEKIAFLRSNRAVIIDRKSKPKYGPKVGKAFSSEDHGVKTEMTNLEVEIVETFELGTGLAANAAVVMNEVGFERVVPLQRRENISLGLIQLEDDLTDNEIEAVADRIRERLKREKDVVVLSRKEVLDREKSYWLYDKSIGIIFMMGVAVAFIVGIAIVYQVLATDVANQIGEYATLKAMGYPNSYLASVVVNQATFLAVLGYITGWILSVGLFWVTSSLAKIPIQMDPLTMVVVFIVTLLMCVFSGLLALRKAYAAEPADLF